MNDIKLHPKNAIFHSLNDLYQDLNLKPVNLSIDDKEFEYGRKKQEIQSVTVLQKNANNEGALF